MCRRQRRQRGGSEGSELCFLDLCEHRIENNVFFWIRTSSSTMRNWWPCLNLVLVWFEGARANFVKWQKVLKTPFFVTAEIVWIENQNDRFWYPPFFPNQLKSQTFERFRFPISGSTQIFSDGPSLSKLWKGSAAFGRQRKAAIGKCNYGCKSAG